MEVKLYLLAFGVGLGWDLFMGKTMGITSIFLLVGVYLYGVLRRFV